jgi:hypothetical protein
MATSLKKRSLVNACLVNNRLEAAEFLAKCSVRVDLADAARLGSLYPRHSLALGGNRRIPTSVKLLLRHNPPLEAENRYVGTPLGADPLVG